MSRIIMALGCTGLLSCATAAQAQHVVGDGCGNCAACRGSHCLSAFKHIQEGPPRIRVQRGCPRPVCDPCALPNWGYYETCWRPWPGQPNWAHCPVPPPGATIQLNPQPLPPGQPGQAPPQPGKLRSGL
jgi:hypothetical protein